MNSKKVIITNAGRLNNRNGLKGLTNMAIEFQKKCHGRVTVCENCCFLGAANSRYWLVATLHCTDRNRTWWTVVASPLKDYNTWSPDVSTMWSGKVRTPDGNEVNMKYKMQFDTQKATAPQVVLKNLPKVVWHFEKPFPNGPRFYPQKCKYGLNCRNHKKCCRYHGRCTEHMVLDEFSNSGPEGSSHGGSYHGGSSHGGSYHGGSSHEGSYSSHGGSSHGGSSHGGSSHEESSHDGSNWWQSPEQPTEEAKTDSEAQKAEREEEAVRQAFYQLVEQLCGPSLNVGKLFDKAMNRSKVEDQFIWLTLLTRLLLERKGGESLDADPTWNNTFRCISLLIHPDKVEACTDGLTLFHEGCNNKIEIATERFKKLNNLKDELK